MKTKKWQLIIARPKEGQDFNLELDKCFDCPAANVQIIFLNKNKICKITEAIESDIRKLKEKNDMSSRTHIFYLKDLKKRLKYATNASLNDILIDSVKQHKCIDIVATEHFLVPMLTAGTFNQNPINF